MTTCDTEVVAAAAAAAFVAAPVDGCSEADDVLAVLRPVSRRLVTVQLVKIKFDSIRFDPDLSVDVGKLNSFRPH